MRRSLILLASILPAGPRRRGKADHLRACKAITLTFVGALAAAAWGYSVSEARQSAPAAPFDVVISFVGGIGHTEANPKYFTTKTTSPLVRFRDAATDEDGFIVERCFGSGCTSFVEIARLVPARGGDFENFFWDRTGGVTAGGQIVRYRVAAYKNSGGNSAYATSNDFQLANDTIQADATALTAAANGPYRVDIFRRPTLPVTSAAPGVRRL